MACPVLMGSNSQLLCARIGNFFQQPCSLMRSWRFWAYWWPAHSRATKTSGAQSCEKIWWKAAAKLQKDSCCLDARFCLLIALLLVFLAPPQATQPQQNRQLCRLVVNDLWVGAYTQTLYWGKSVPPTSFIYSFIYFCSQSWFWKLLFIVQ